MPMRASPRTRSTSAGATSTSTCAIVRRCAESAGFFTIISTARTGRRISPSRRRSGASSSAFIPSWCATTSPRLGAPPSATSSSYAVAATWNSTCSTTAVLSSDCAPAAMSRQSCHRCLRSRNGRSLHSSPREGVNHHRRPAADHDRVEDGGMYVQGKPLDEPLGKEGARKRHGADEQRDSDHLRAHHASKPEGRKFGEPNADGDDGVSRDYGGAFKSGRHQKREKDNASADGAAGERSPAEASRCQSAA